MWKIHGNAGADIYSLDWFPKAGRYKEAWDGYTEAINLDSTNSALYGNRAAAGIYAQRYKEVRHAKYHWQLIGCPFEPAVS